MAPPTKEGAHGDHHAGHGQSGSFVSGALVLLLVPGPAVLFIFARSIEQGRLAGFVSILGIHAATLVHIAAAALGLSALLASSALAFGVVKYAGAAYLIWLGLRKIFGRPEQPDTAAPLKVYARWSLFRDGFIVNLLNPKTATPTYDRANDKERGQECPRPSLA